MAAGYNDGSSTIAIEDAEELTVSLNVASISEQGGAATGTVTRSNTDIAQSLEVQLLSSDPSEANVPTSVTIPAGQSSVTFAILAVDDALWMERNL